MTTVLDVAQYIVEKKGPMTAMKLQKLVYYSQAWSLVWDEKPLFRDPIQAWANGPVSPKLYSAHRGLFEVKVIAGVDSKALTKQHRQVVDKVLAYYGDKPSQWLSDLTHQEEPWKQARRGLAAGEAGQTVIKTASMAEYYSSL